MTDNSMVMFDPTSAQQLPAHLQGANLTASAGLLAVIGAGGNRIGLKGSRFRIVVAGSEEAVRDENYLDVIIVGAVDAISRVYYQGEYESGKKVAPTCYAADGIAPGADVKQPQSDKCSTCPQNVKGSKIVGSVKMKACAYFQRLIVRLVGDDTNTLYKLDVKSQGLFGESYANVHKYSLGDFTKFLSNRATDVAAVVTRLSFDTEQSVPKLLFQVMRFITPEEFVHVSSLVGSDEVKKLLDINMTTVDLSHETTADEPNTKAATPTETASTVPPAQAAAQQAAAVAAKAAAAPPPPTATPPAPKRYQKTEKAGALDLRKDFLDQGWTADQLLEHGYMVELPPEPVKAAPPPPAAKAPPPPPATTAAAVVESVPMPTKAAPPPPVAKPAAAAAVQETSSDDEIAAIIGELV